MVEIQQYGYQRCQKLPFDPENIFRDVGNYIDTLDYFSKRQRTIVFVIHKIQCTCRAGALRATATNFAHKIPV